jgi:lysophospholipase L1-like esterase
MITAKVRARPSIVLFGDSITEFAFGESGQVGWASLLSSMYTRRADVLSRGFSGYNTRHALGVLESIFLAGKKSDDAKCEIPCSGSASSSSTPLLFCTVFFGANDASLPTARQHLSVDEYDRNIREIIRTIRKNTAPCNAYEIKNQVPIILFTPPPAASKAWDHYCTVTSPRPLSPRSNEKVREYGMKVKEIGKEMDCAVVDSFSLLGGDHNEEHYSQYLTDGLHLNGQGNTILFNGLVDVLKKHHKNLLPMEDGDGRNGSSGIPLEEKLWSELC